VAKHYDNLDHFYRKLWGEHLHHGLWLTGRETPEQAVRQLVVEVAAQARIEMGSRVVDVGCGYGATARLLVDEFGAAVTGVTISSAQHGYAESVRPGTANPRYLLRDWYDNGFPDGKFDAVVSLESSEHMPDKPRFFGEVARVLKPAGRFIVCAWLSRLNPKGWEVRHLLEPICCEGRLPSMGTVEDYRNWIEDAGLEVERIHDVSGRVRKTWVICARRVLHALVTDPATLRFVVTARGRDRVFAWTLFRILAAYYAGSMRYAILTARKPPGG
jgi:tocopherol O-methyltransferase